MQRDQNNTAEKVSKRRKIHTVQYENINGSDHFWKPRLRSKDNNKQFLK